MFEGFHCRFSSSSTSEIFSCGNFYVRYFLYFLVPSVCNNNLRWQKSIWKLCLALHIFWYSWRVHPFSLRWFLCARSGSPQLSMSAGICYRFARRWRIWFMQTSFITIGSFVVSICLTHVGTVSVCIPCFLAHRLSAAIIIMIYDTHLSPLCNTYPLYLQAETISGRTTCK